MPNALKLSMVLSLERLTRRAYGQRSSYMNAIFITIAVRVSSSQIDPTGYMTVCWLPGGWRGTAAYIVRSGIATRVPHDAAITDMTHLFWENRR
jgi:hypothetical protein